MWSKLGRVLTAEEFQLKLQVEYPLLKREDEYINSKVPIRFSCVMCGKIFKKKPKELKNLECKCIKNGLDYKESIAEKNIELVQNYKNTRTKLPHRCLVCRLEFLTSPKVLRTSKIGCPSCSGKIFSTPKYRSLLPSNIILIDPVYGGSNFKHRHKCLDCESHFVTKPNYIIHMKTNCPICSKSKGEREVIRYLGQKNLKYQTEYTINISQKNLRFDFFIEELRTFIEYDGIQHYKPKERFGGLDYFTKLRKYDQLKNTWCAENGYKIIRPPHFVEVDEYLSKII